MSFRIGDRVRLREMNIMGEVVAVDSTCDSLARLPDMHMVTIYNSGETFPCRANQLVHADMVKNVGFEIGDHVRFVKDRSAGEVVKLEKTSINIVVTIRLFDGSMLTGLDSEFEPYSPPGAVDVGGVNPPTTVSSTDDLDPGDILFFGYNQDTGRHTYNPDEMPWDGTTGKTGAEFDLDALLSLASDPWKYDDEGNELPADLADRRKISSIKLAANIHAEGFRSVEDMDECVNFMMPYVQAADRELNTGIQKGEESRIKADGYVKMYSGVPGSTLFVSEKEAECTEDELAGGQVWVEEVFIGRRVPDEKATLNQACTMLSVSPPAKSWGELLEAMRSRYVRDRG